MANYFRPGKDRATALGRAMTGMNMQSIMEKRSDVNSSDYQSSNGDFDYQERNIKVQKHSMLHFS